jgi:CMP-N,N'-diacetyllegionaminic acid synthase
MPTINALIPARAGSRRIKGKNFREIGGHPLLAYTIAAAKSAGIFQRIVVSTDSTEGERIALQFKADIHYRNPADASDTATDCDWVSSCLEAIQDQTDYFAILRPTAPFRQPETIRLAWRTIQEHPYATGLKAVSPVREHPGKMWVIRDNAYMEPLMNWATDGLPAYERPTQALPTVWVQNASLDIALTRNPTVCHNILGAKIIPFFTRGHEGFDLNTEEDWLLAERLIETGAAQLPEIGGNA